MRLDEAVALASTHSAEGLQGGADQPVGARGNLFKALPEARYMPRRYRPLAQ
jgi:hypothetical protein